MPASKDFKKSQHKNYPVDAAYIREVDPYVVVILNSLNCFSTLIWPYSAANILAVFYSCSPNYILCWCMLLLAYCASPHSSAFMRSVLVSTIILYYTYIHNYAKWKNSSIILQALSCSSHTPVISIQHTIICDVIYQWKHYYM